jgi:hypothetical protein
MRAALGDLMNDDPPALYPSATELWQYAQAITNISALAARLRTRLAAARERDGRLAFAEANNAALHHDARQHPPLRLMTDTERDAWHHRVPATLATAAGEDPVTVWTARLTNPDGSTSAEWGLQAHTWHAGRPTTSLFAVCRDAEDALAMTRHLRQHGTPEHLTRLHQLAADAPTQHTHNNQPAPVAGPPPGRPRSTERLVLSEDDWAAALRRELPTHLASKIIAKDPAHPHHTAWRELHQLANHHVAGGADPAHLAAAVHTVPAWRNDVRNPPALAHWAITHTPTTPNPDPTRPAQPRHTPQDRPDHRPTRPHTLDPNNPEHRLRAKAQFGRSGADADRALATSFPTLVPTARAASHDHPNPPPDTATMAQLAAEVERLDPTKPIDRRAAHIMLGRVPTDIDRLLAKKFADDPHITNKLRNLYPHGLPSPTTTATPNHGERHTPPADNRPQNAAPPAAPPRDRELTANSPDNITIAAGQQPPPARRANHLHQPAAPQQRR